jgi:hypothetical protein
MYFDYQAISKDFLKLLPDRARQIIARRFGLEAEQRETLQAIGEDFDITRERVRQIEGASLNKMAKRVKTHKPVFEFFSNQLKTTGRLRKEDVFFQVVSPELLRNQVFFLLSLDKEFERILETENFHTLWTIDKKILGLAEKAVKQAAKKLERASRPLRPEEIQSPQKKELPALLAYLEASKIVQKGPRGFWGLRDWPEINPRGVRDKAHIVFKKEKRPLHFSKVAEIINKSKMFEPFKKVHFQTVHNELIKDSRFVLVGRGIYALAEWGYNPGTVSDVIVEVLKEAKIPLSKEEVLKGVLKKRFVAKNTILLNLHNKKRFQRNPKGRYQLRSTKLKD